MWATPEPLHVREVQRYWEGGGGGGCQEVFQGMQGGCQEVWGRRRDGLVKGAVRNQIAQGTPFDCETVRGFKV